MEQADRDFLEALYRAENEKLRAFAGRTLASAQLTEDALQETFLTAVLKIAELRASPNPTGWLFNVLKYHVMRQNRTWAALLRKMAVLDDAQLYHLDQQEEELRFRLPQESARLLVQYYVEGQSLEVLAREAGCSVDAVKMRISRAKKALKQELEPTAHQEGGDDHGGAQG